MHSKAGVVCSVRCAMCGVRCATGAAMRAPQEVDVRTDDVTDRRGGVVALVEAGAVLAGVAPVVGDDAVDAELHRPRLPPLNHRLQHVFVRQQHPSDPHVDTRNCGARRARFGCRFICNRDPNLLSDMFACQYHIVSRQYFMKKPQCLYLSSLLGTRLQINFSDNMSQSRTLIHLKPQ